MSSFQRRSKPQIAEPFRGVSLMEAGLTLAAEEARIIKSTNLPSKRLAGLLLLGLTAVFVTSVLLRPPAGDYFTICAFKNFTGLPCPGCGLTHSFCALGKGDVVGAFVFNALGPPLFIAFLFIWVRSAFVLLNIPAAVNFF